LASFRSAIAASSSPASKASSTEREADEDDFVYDANYLGIKRSDDLVIIQLTVSNTRPSAQKQELFWRIVEKLTANPGLRPEEIFINLVEVLPENWSFGNGVAQYVQ
jgi:4-oxalocrotonate tautomerase